MLAQRFNIINPVASSCRGFSARFLMCLSLKLNLGSEATSKASGCRFYITVRYGLTYHLFWLQGRCSQSDQQL